MSRSGGIFRGLVQAEREHGPALRGIAHPPGSSLSKDMAE